MFFIKDLIILDFYSETLNPDFNININSYCTNVQYKPRKIFFIESVRIFFYMYILLLIRKKHLKLVQSIVTMISIIIVLSVVTNTFFKDTNGFKVPFPKRNINIAVKVQLQSYSNIAMFGGAPTNNHGKYGLLNQQ